MSHYYPHSDMECSIQCEINEMINHYHGEQVDIEYGFEHCNPFKTATWQTTLINTEKYVIIQLKIFGYNNIIGAFKIIQNHIMKEEINSIFLRHYVSAQ